MSELSEMFELHLEQELKHCECQYNLYQEVHSLASSGMTDLQGRMKRILSELDRLERARRLFGSKDRKRLCVTDRTIPRLGEFGN